jgi:hypothetical protein
MQNLRPSNSIRNSRGSRSPAKYLQSTFEVCFVKVRPLFRKRHHKFLCILKKIQFLFYLFHITNLRNLYIFFNLDDHAVWQESFYCTMMMMVSSSSLCLILIFKCNNRVQTSLKKLPNKTNRILDLKIYKYTFKKTL